MAVKDGTQVANEARDTDRAIACNPYLQLALSFYYYVVTSVITTCIAKEAQIRQLSIEEDAQLNRMEDQEEGIYFLLSSEPKFKQMQDHISLRTEKEREWDCKNMEVHYRHLRATISSDTCSER